VDGKTILGLPSARLDYGLLLATSSMFDPKHVIDLDKDGQLTVSRRSGDAPVCLTRSRSISTTMAA